MPNFLPTSLHHSCWKLSVIFMIKFLAYLVRCHILMEKRWPHDSAVKHEKVLAQVVVVHILWRRSQQSASEWWNWLHLAYTWVIGLQWSGSCPWELSLLGTCIQRCHSGLKYCTVLGRQFFIWQWKRNWSWASIPPHNCVYSLTLPSSWCHARQVNGSVCSKPLLQYGLVRQVGNAAAL